MMVKQAHTLLSDYLIEEMQIEEIKQYRKSLRFGSMLPDRSPKYRMKDHEFTETWDDTKKLIQSIEGKTVTNIHSERAVCRQIGIVLHYLADYFTCPHNPSYGFSLIKHGIYEGRQLYDLRVYLRSPKAKEQFIFQKKFAMQIHNPEELFSHIERMHGLYLEESKHTPLSDCRWILGVCSCAVMVMVTKVYGNTEQSTCKQ